MDEQYSFHNQNGQFIQLYFSNKKSVNAQLNHVWIICRYEGKWLLTNHKERGFEFPGGKIERNEHDEQAVHREVFEETGGTIKALQYIGFYEVSSGRTSFRKGIYFANVQKLSDKDDYLETNGPILFEDLSKEIVMSSQFSFIMQDDVLVRTLEYLKRKDMY